MLIIAVIFSYLILRKNEIDNFKSDMKWFLSIQEPFDNQNTKEHLKSLNQKKSNFFKISNKHIDAINNYNLDNVTPSINLFLNTSKIEFSWHYSAIFIKSERGWEIQSCEEYVSPGGE